MARSVISMVGVLILMRLDQICSDSNETGSNEAGSSECLSIREIQRSCKRLKKTKRFRELRNLPYCTSSVTLLHAGNFSI